MVAKIDVHKFGSNEPRKKMNHIPHLDLSKNRTQEPIIHGSGYKPRETRTDQKKEVNTEKDKGKARRGSIQLEPSYDD